MNNRFSIPKLSTIPRKYRIMAVYTASVTAASALISWLAIRNLGAILALFGEETFARIFAQLTDAAICPGFLQAAVIALGFSLLIVKPLPRSLRILIGILGAFCALLLCIVMTTVNDIRFEDVLSFLARLLKSGALDEL